MTKLLPHHFSRPVLSSPKTTLRNNSGFLILVLTGTLFLLAGCSSRFYKEFTIDKDPPTSLSIDAGQRLLLVTDRGGENKKQRIVCAEPSPDMFAINAIGMALNIEPPVADGKGSISVGSAESAIAFGIRTQTVQLLRDGLYRACEAYLNGVLGKDEYHNIVKGYDEVLITLLALEGLTQQVPSQPPKLEGKVQTVDKDGTPPEAAATQNTVTKAEKKLPDEQMARQIHAIVRDYYCFQLGLKQIFYPKGVDQESKRKTGEASPTIVKYLCSDVAAASGK